MKRFTELYLQLDQTNKTLGKVAAIASYFQDASPADAAWAIYLLSGQKLRQLVPTKLLRQWAAEVAGIEPWLFEECYDVVGDLAETIALILPDATPFDANGRNNDSEFSNLAPSVDSSLAQWIDHMLPLREMSTEQQRATLIGAWSQLPAAHRFVFHKIITGSFRIGVSQALLVRGVAEATGIDADTLSHRLMGNWQPSALAYQKLLDPDLADANASRPYPFFLAHPLEATPEAVLGDMAQWQAEWKWDGIRATVVRRNEDVFVWSRGGELITDRFPEIATAAASLPQGTVLDGEILAWSEGNVLPFAELQRRIGRKNLTKRILEEVPVMLMAFDCLELDGQDIRELPLAERRKRLEHLLSHNPPQPSPSFDWPLFSQSHLEETTPDDRRLQISPLLQASDWETLARIRTMSREHGAEGLMLKRLTSPYRAGRPRGDWWKWKIEPYTIDAVLIYAQRGHGKRASLYTDYTFAVWDEGKLVPFAKAYSGLTDEEIGRVDAFVRRHTLEKFGPVRSVKAELVFELAFEDIRLSTRHKSGIAVRFPRIVRWRTDKTMEEADSLESIKQLLAGGAAS